MHIHIVICPKRDGNSESFYNYIKQESRKLKNLLKTFATYYNEETMEIYQNSECYFPKCEISGYSEYPFFQYSNHFIYINYDGFDLADLQIFGYFNNDNHAIFLSKEEDLGNICRDRNNNYSFVEEISKDFLDKFIFEHSKRI